MRIGIEAQRIFRKKKHGMDIVAIELIKALQLIDQSNNYFIFTNEDEDDSCISPKSNFKIIKIPRSSYPYWEQIQLPKAVRKYNLDLLHCTSNTAPLNIKIPLIVTVHDIIYLEKLNLLRGTPYQILGNLYRRWIVPKIIKKSSAIITVSQYEREIIKNYFKNDLAIVIYNGVKDIFKRVSDPLIIKRIRDKYCLPENYIFFIANTDPKKNTEGVLRAYSLLKKNKDTPKLLLLDINRRYLLNLIKKIGDKELINHINICDYIPNSELPVIYSSALMFLYPSIRESFGIPILEAMACGTPVITSNTSSMPEIAGNSALLVNPFKPEELASSINELIYNHTKRAELSFKGLQRVEKFSWIDNARITLGLYNEIYEKKIPPIHYL